VRIFESGVSLARLVGANKEDIEREIPRIASLPVDDLAEVAAHGDVVVIGNPSPTFLRLAEFCRPGQTIVDLAHMRGLSGRLASTTEESPGEPAGSNRLRHDDQLRITKM
jgi:hypothetical protein